MLVIGLMSGTSCDGVSAALTEIRKDSRVRVLDYHTLSYSESLRRRLLALPTASVPELARLNFILGERLADAAKRVYRRGVRLVGSHGHTAYHEPRGRERCTLQIGEPSIIAQRLGVPVVADFRPADVAVGGEGAPLVPFFDRAIFGRGSTRVLLNLGGIANVSVVGKSVRGVVAFDTGPGNTLIDEAVRRLEGKPFDRVGEIASRGRVDLVLLGRLLNHPYFRRRPPKSTGREVFSWAQLRLGAPSRDLISTLTFLTARTVFDALERFVFPHHDVRELIVSGGGVFNRTLMRFLSALLGMIPVRDIAAYGIHPLAKEPAAFALLAYETWRGRAANLPSATGARRPAILGKVVKA